MARPLRIEYDGAVYHVTSRGNARKSIYKADDDRKTFLDILQQVNKLFNWLCHAYCLMNNHYHMVIETPDGNLSKGMRQLNGVYTQRFNRHHRQVGHIFQGRYKAIAIEKESYLAEVIRYVVLNPIRAKAVQDPGQWGWSSYRGTAGLEEPHPCLRREWILGQFDTVQRRAERKYREFVRSGIDKNDLWTEVKGQSILGEDEFVGQLIGHVKGHEDIKEIPRMQRYMGRPSLSELLGGVAPADKNSSESKICKAVMDHAYSLKEVADHLNIHYSTVSRMVSRASHACNKT